MAEKRLRLLMVVAHPDDEIYAAGTAANYIKAGHSASIAWFTRGDLGHMTLPREEVARVRTGEAEASAKILGADCRFLDYPDSEVPHDREATMKVVDLIREIKPNILITHNAVDHHPDHRNTHLNVADAMHFAALPLLKTAFPAHDPDALFFLSSAENAEVFVDITETMETKVTMARCHRSQYEEWMVQHQAGTDKAYPTETEKLVDLLVRDPSRAAGIRSGVRYAEGFIPFAPKKPKATQLLPLE